MGTTTITWAVGFTPDIYSTDTTNTPAKMTMIRNNTAKIAYADVAFGTTNIIEYSFIEPPVTVYGGNLPSLHFRHRSRANIAWCDGHVSAEKFEWTVKKNDPINYYGSDNELMKIGLLRPARRQPLPAGLGQRC